MTSREKINLLRQAVHDGERLDVLLNKAEHFYEQARRATSLWGCERVSGGPRRDKVQDSVCKLQTEFERFKGLAEAYQQETCRALAAINALELPAHRTVLTLRYFGGLDWEQIAKRMEKSREALTYPAKSESIDKSAQMRYDNGDVGKPTRIEIRLLKKKKLQRFC